MNTSEYIDPADIKGINKRLVDWAAGREEVRPVAVQQVGIHDDGLPALVEAVQRLLKAKSANASQVAVVIDDTKMLRRGGDAKAEIIENLEKGINESVHQLVLYGSEGLPFQPTTVAGEELTREVSDAAVIVSIGSGSITDVAKFARHQLALKAGSQEAGPALVCVPTAASVTAFTSALAVLTVEGVKRTRPTIAPDVVICDMPTLTAAPPDMTAAGFGDVLARSVAYGDWFLAHQLGMDEGYSEIPGRLLLDAETRMLQLAKSVGAGELEGVRSVVDGLLLAGMAMSVVNQTAPVSGWEHVMSHFLDLTTKAEHRAPAFHGAQVGVTTLVASRAYEALGDALSPHHVLREMAPQQMRERLDEVVAPWDPTGASRAEIWRDLEKKIEQWNGAGEKRQAFAKRWTDGEIQAGLERLVRPSTHVDKSLELAGAARRFADLPGPVPAETARVTVQHAHCMRVRFTLGDLLDRCGWLTDETATHLAQG